MDGCRESKIAPHEHLFISAIAWINVPALINSTIRIPNFEYESCDCVVHHTFYSAVKWTKNKSPSPWWCLHMGMRTYVLACTFVGCANNVKKKNISYSKRVRVKKKYEWNLWCRTEHWERGESHGLWTITLHIIACTWFTSS